MLDGLGLHISYFWCWLFTLLQTCWTPVKPRGVGDFGKLATAFIAL